MSDGNGSRPIEQGFVELEGGGRLVYEAAGSGYPLVLVHRGLLDRRMWDDQFHALAQRFRVIRYDLRGSGDSQHGSGTFAHHADLEHLLGALGVSRAHLVGLGLGASICIDYTLEFPTRVSALALVSPSVAGYDLASGPVKQYQMTLFTALARMMLEEAVNLSLHMWVDGPQRQPDAVDPAVRARVEDMLIDGVSRPLHSYVPQMLDPVAITRLAEIDVPALLVVGEMDVSDTHDIAGRLAGEIAGAQKVVMPSVGHLPNMEQPDTFNQLLVDFLSAQSPT